MNLAQARKVKNMPRFSALDSTASARPLRCHVQRSSMVDIDASETSRNPIDTNYKNKDCRQPALLGTSFLQVSDCLFFL